MKSLLFLIFIPGLLIPVDRCHGSPRVLEIPVGNTNKTLKVREYLLNSHSELLKYHQEKKGLYRFEYHFPGGTFKGLISGWDEAVLERWKSGKLTFKDLENIKDYWLSLSLDLNILIEKLNPRIETLRKRYPVPRLDLRPGNDSIHFSAQTRWNLIKPIVPWFPGISLIDNHTPVSFSLVLRPTIKKKLLYFEFVHAQLMNHDLTSTFNSVFIPRIYLDLKNVLLFNKNVKVGIRNGQFYFSSKSRGDPQS
ncbi:hypothetical protein HOF92_04390 [bacterium]|jgi:hypothetical protein|nr:hypothetical protein [bacterium]